jgi:hypothetical protein
VAWREIHVITQLHCFNTGHVVKDKRGERIYFGFESKMIASMKVVKLRSKSEKICSRADKTFKSFAVSCPSSISSEHSPGCNSGVSAQKKKAVMLITSNNNPRMANPRT